MMSYFYTNLSRTGGFSTLWWILDWDPGASSLGTWRKKKAIKNDIFPPYWQQRHEGPLKREGGVNMGESCFLDSLKISRFPPLLLLKDSTAPWILVEISLVSWNQSQKYPWSREITDLVPPNPGRPSPFTFCLTSVRTIMGRCLDLSKRNCVSAKINSNQISP